MENFVAMDAQRAAIQVMETVNIIASSKNIETIISRYNFLLSTLPTLKKYSTAHQYSYYIQLAKEQYRNTYPNRPIEDFQNSILSNPNQFPVDSFYCQALANAMQRFTMEQLLQIESLKTESSKQKRRIKVNQTIQKAISELKERLSGAECFETTLQQLTQLMLSTN